MWGGTPSWAIPRTASSPSWKLRNMYDSNALASGARWTLIVAWVMFLVARVINRLKRMQAAEPAAAPAATRQETLLTEIRDLLKDRSGQAKA